jgi:hypothetical protein
VTTKFFPYDGKDLKINADVLPDGSITVEILDENANPIAISKTITKSAQYKKLNWSDEIGDSPIQLRFKLNRAKLYSISFE